MRRGAGTRRALLTTLLSWNGFVNGFQQPAPTWTRAVAIPGFSPERPVGGGIQCRLLGPIFRRPYLLLSASTEAGGGDSSFFSQAQDLESLQSLFARYCDKQGLMTRSALRKVPAIADLLVSTRAHCFSASRWFEKGDSRSVTIYARYALELLRDLNAGHSCILC
jgi:hypothetical protein